MGTYKTVGIVIKKNNFGEADRLFTICSRHYGKIKAIGKGVRRSTSKKGGNLGLFNLVKLFLASGRNLDIITEVELINSFANLKNDLKRLSGAFYLCELAEVLTVENQASENIFDLLKEGLSFLNQNDNFQKSFFADFQKKLLLASGFGVPQNTKNPEGLEKYIESIINKKLKSRQIWHRI